MGVLSAPETPNITDWMQGWGSLLALPLSLGAMVFTGLLLLHEIRVRRQERYHNDSAQARLIRVDEARHDDGADRKGSRIRYRIHNRSDAPILDVHVLHPSPEGDRYEESGQRITVEGREKGWFSFTDPALTAKIGEAKFVHSLDLPYVLVFTDAEGRKWSRYMGAGLPKRVLGEVAFQSESIVGLVAVLWNLPTQRQAVRRWLDAPRRSIKRRLRRRIWRRRQESIERDMVRIAAFMEMQRKAETAGIGDSDRGGSVVD